jgi:hypothetical protein
VDEKRNHRGKLFYVRCQVFAQSIGGRVVLINFTISNPAYGTKYVNKNDLKSQ